MVGLAHQDDGPGAAHAAFSIDAGFPEGLDGIIEIHDLNARDLGGNDLLGRGGYGLRRSLLRFGRFLLGQYKKILADGNLVKVVMRPSK